MKLMWTENLSVGVRYFDEDHKRLIRMINELHDATQNVDSSGNIPEDEIEIALHRLENYFQYHCMQEEVFMATIKYPGIAEHKQCHQEFIAKVTAMSRSFSGSRDPKHGGELMQFMYDWLTDHIHGIDKQYGEYLQRENISQDTLKIVARQRTRSAKAHSTAP